MTRFFKRSRLIRLVLSSAKWALIVGYWYLASYVLMMDWRIPAYDERTASYAYESHYRMTRYDVPHDVEFTILVPVACWANQFFWPVDASLGWLKRYMNEHQTTYGAYWNSGARCPHLNSRMGYVLMRGRPWSSAIEGAQRLNGLNHDHTGLCATDDGWSLQ